MGGPGGESGQRRGRSRLKWRKAPEHPVGWLPAQSDSPSSRHSKAGEEPSPCSP
jgi:hypothetical protein